jgi:xanthine dehydrogenase small subunit
MTTFILNNQLINSEKPTGTSLLDFIRYEKDLPGTKIGCREGDCGACTVMAGTLENGRIKYETIVSCLTPLGNVNGKHIVTIEGINMEQLSPVQKTFIENASSQCGFCTPGFIMSLTAYSLSEQKPDKQRIIASMSGNICRCTGYKSIEKAASDILILLKDKDITVPVDWQVKEKFLPEYFLTIPERLAKIEKPDNSSEENEIVIAGGTDLMVRKADFLAEENINLLIKFIKAESGKCMIGSAVTPGDIERSPIIRENIPEIISFLKLFASQPIRNMATVAGNIVNASPIGDLTIMLLALNADVIIEGPDGIRSTSLRNFYFGYKETAVKKNELVKSIEFPLPSKPFLFNFEKVSKRNYLDIASVNSAISLNFKDERVEECFLSAGGVSPVPLFLSATCNFLKGKTISPEIILQANTIMQGEISPVTDVRGSMNYKRLLLRQLFFAHFIKLFPGTIELKDLVTKRRRDEETKN